MLLMLMIILGGAASLSMLGVLVEDEPYKRRALTIIFSVATILLTLIYLLN